MPTKLFCWGDYAEYYDYLADGTKLSVTDTEENGLYYLGSLVYEKHANTIGLESVPFSSGRIVATSGNDTEVRYFLTDHLGSVRVVATDKDNVLERNDYQPFGKRWNTASLPVADNRYRFSGKEDQAFVGLPFSDYGTRMYDSERMRWLTQDPLMEKYYSIGQYNYCAGNPIRFSDKKGESIKDAVVGLLTGVASNITGNSALRDSYTPDNSSHYNIGLGAGDVASVAAGAMLINLGGQAVAGGIAIGGGATVASGGAAAGVAVPAGAAISGAGALAVGTGVALMSNTAKNASQGYNRGNGPKPNDGKGAPHGNPDHNAKIDDKIKSLRKGEATDIRKNQAQVDVNGNKVGNNRPDVQYNKNEYIIITRWIAAQLIMPPMNELSERMIRTPFSKER